MAKEKFIINLFKGNFIFELKKNIISKIIQESIYLFKLSGDNRHLQQSKLLNPPK